MTTVPRFGLGVSNCRDAVQVVKAVKEAEEIGAEIAFIAEDTNCRDAVALSALAASATDRIRLSTGVINPYTRNPTSIAMAIATLDEISGGRMGLGLGSSSPSLIETQMGIPHRGSPRVMREATEIIRALLAGEEVTYSGQVFHYANAKLAVLPVQPRVPIFYAAMGPRMLALAGTHADGLLLNVGASPSYIRWAVDIVRVSAEAAGRDPADITIAAWMSAYPDADGDLQARRWLATMLSIPQQGELLLERAGFDTGILADIRSQVRAYPHAGDPDAAAQYVPSDVARELTLIGTRRQVLDRLDDYRAAGVDIPVLAVSVLRTLYGAGDA